VAEKQQASPLILLAIYGTLNFSYEDTNHSPASDAHTTHTGPEMMPSDVSLGKFLCFIFYCLTNKQYLAERFLSLLASTYLFPPPSYISLQNAELSCRIAIICFLSIVDNSFKLCS
jgi:hypothetical protein